MQPTDAETRIESSEFLKSEAGKCLNNGEGPNLQLVPRTFTGAINLCEGPHCLANLINTGVAGPAPAKGLVMQVESQVMALDS